RERWKADPTVLGRSMRISSRSYTIVGVMPNGFRGNNTTFAPALWLPLSSWSGITKEELQQPSRRWLEIAARPSAGANIREAKAELAAVSTHLEPIANRPEEHRSLAPMTGREARFSGDRTAAFIVSILSIVVGIVLVVASSNVASLLLTRTLARRKEIALRQSLGATRPRIVRQLLTEGLLLAGMGAIGGAILAGWALRFLTAYQIPSPVPILFDLRLDTRTLVFTTLVAVATSILFGLMPALEAARTDLIGRIRRQQQRVRRGLDLMVAVQVAGGVVLMTGASLFVSALGRAARVNPGFVPNHAVAITVDPSLMGYSREQSIVFYRQLLDRARAIPGVRAAGLAQAIPLGFGLASPANVMAQGKLLRTKYNVVDGDFFPAMGTRLIRGRTFDSTDTRASTPVMIVNESLAKTLFAGRDAIGERVCVAGPPEECRQVTGVAEQGKYGTLAEDPAPYFWIPFSQRFAPQMTLVVRTSGESSAYTAVIRREANALEPSLPVIEVRTLEEHMRIPLLEPQIPSFFLTVLSAIGLVLSLAGIIGVTAYAVGSRTKEIGIRMAIGARRIDVLWVILKRAMAVVAIAIVAGVAVSVGFGKLVASLLYGLDPGDPLRLAGVALAMSAAMLMGSFIPAYSASKVDPAITLREE
ncbi:MAG TPA: FtsX-like permease family protein, partial [Bryobacteraceae bacterium]|nr:FtsX-like permease family protein [Bryobacteraceae bacterium]